jgi:alkylhydroperoxidase family enzyme
LGQERVDAVLEGRENDPLFDFVRKINSRAYEIGEEDVAALRCAGHTEEAIYDAINVCCLFNFYNRWIDASGVHAMSEDEHRASGKRMRDRGYLPQR